MLILQKLLPLAVAAPIIACLLWSGCGILTAPVTVPAAIAANTNFSLAGPLLDQDGNPLDAVMLSQQLNHRFWEPINGSTETNEQRLRRFDRTYKVDARGESLKLTFTHEGYYDATYYLRAENSDNIRVDQGFWPLTKEFPVILLPRDKPDVTLQHWSGEIDYSAYPASSAINLNALTQRCGPKVKPTGADPLNSFPLGALYLTLAQSIPPAVNSHGDINPVDVNLPDRITLHITGTDSGFIRIEPRLGYAPIQTSDTAPASGYAPELTFERKRLKEMRTADCDSIIDAREYFFFRANGHYGKGIIMWTRQFRKAEKDVMSTSFFYQLWSQPTADDRNLTSRAAKSI